MYWERVKPYLKYFEEIFINYLYNYEDISDRWHKVMCDILEEVFGEFPNYYDWIEIDILDSIKDNLIKKITNQTVIFSMKTLRNYYRTDIELRNYYSFWEDDWISINIEDIPF